MLFIYIVGCLFFRRVVSSASWLPAEFRTWLWQSSIVVDSFLYISGGEIQRLSPAGTFGPIYNNATFAIDLSSSWTVSNVTATVNYATSSSFPYVRRPGLWYDSISKTVNAYGGEEYGEVDWSGKPAVWSFPPGNATADWSLRYRKGDTSSFGQMTSKAKGMTARSPKAFFDLGGFANSNSDTVFPPDGIEYAQSGLLKFQNEGEVWTNDTSLTSQPSFMLNGEAQFVPLFGKEGVVVFIGGDRPTKQLYVAGGSMVGLNAITVYDVESKKFYEQKTRGPIPLQRNFFCSVGTSGADNKTWEIFVYGGVQGAYSTPTDSLAQENLGIVYILSLPSFTWTSFANKNQDPFWRFGHSCSIIGSRQMLSIGGVRANSSDLDTFENGMKIFDMSTLEWKNTFDASAKPYERHAIVQSLYDTKGVPTASVTWNDPALATVFKQNTPAPPSTDTPSTPTGNSNLASKAIETGAIVGGVVGGLVGLAMLAGVAFLLMRRRKRKSKEIGAIQSSDETINKNGPYEAYSLVPGGDTLPEMEARERAQELGHPERVEMETREKAQEMHHNDHTQRAEMA